MVASRAHHDDAKSFGAGPGESPNILLVPFALISSSFGCVRFRSGRH